MLLLPCALLQSYVLIATVFEPVLHGATNNHRLGFPVQPSL